MNRLGWTAVLATALAAGLALFGCGSRSAASHQDDGGLSFADDHFAGLVAKGQFGTAPEKLKADAERLARERYTAPGDRDKFVYSYYEGYESGLTQPRGTMTVGLDESNVFNRGVQAGRSAAIADLQAGKPKATLLDFGYTAVDVRGRLHIEFERQEFFPEGLSRQWWVTLSPEAEEAYEQAGGGAGRAGRDAHFEARLAGFLAPAREGLGVGHMNQYDREIVVTKILEIKKVEP